jgi:hypothetical protein
MGSTVQNAPNDFPPSRRLPATASPAKRGTVALTASDPCPRCGHLLSAHPVQQAGQCDLCACVAQDVPPPRVNA